MNDILDITRCPWPVCAVKLFLVSSITPTSKPPPESAQYHTQHRRSCSLLLSTMMVAALTLPAALKDCCLAVVLLLVPVTSLLGAADKGSFHSFSKQRFVLVLLWQTVSPDSQPKHGCFGGVDHRSSNKSHRHALSSH
jgi:hypothetical protein